KIICSIYESRGISPVVGMCFIDTSTSHMTITEIVDSQTYVRSFHKIMVHQQSQMNIVVPIQHVTPSKTTFMKLLSSNLEGDIRVIPKGKQHFSTDPLTKDLILGCFKEADRYSIQCELNDKFYAMCAVHAAITFMKESSQYHFVLDSFNVKYECSESTLFVDTNTIKSLELVENLSDPLKGLSLFKFLNSTNTKMGERLLRNNLLQPLTNETYIVSRYEAVQELIGKTALLLDLQCFLKEFLDLDKLFSVLIKKNKVNIDGSSAQRINTAILLKQTMITCKKVSSALMDSSSSLLIQVKNILTDEVVEGTVTMIDETISEDCFWASKPIDLKNQQSHAVKSGTNGLLDISRQLYKNILDEIMNTVDDLSKEHEIALESKYDTKRGFYIQIKDPTIKAHQLPEIFINRLSKPKTIECTTLEIVKLNLRLENAHQEILLMSEQAVETLLLKCKKNTSSYFMISEAVSLLDLICCFAQNALKSTRQYICAELTNKLLIKGARHPVLETTLDHSFVPNDIISLPESSRVNIITGANMTGKSVYLKQLALIVIMAQIGSLIPADYAQLKIFKSLHARTCVDSFEANASTFSSEMTDIALILRNCTQDSLVLIDELGRGSSYTDGFSICLAIVEKLIDLQATCYICTHFVDIPKILKTKMGVLEMYMSADIVESVGGEEIKMNYKLSAGTNWMTGYGTRMVKSLNIFPSVICEDALIISNILRLAKNGLNKNEQRLHQANKNRLILDFCEVIKYIVEHTSTSEVMTQLQLAESAFVENISKLTGSESSEDIEDEEDE
ncbi:hypothetical protein CANARDRAFT_183282, partial [[Candida] arabinofermentans NRRL YB-2248]